MSEFMVKADIEEFRESGMLWLINRTLHIFGWAIVASYDDETGDFIEIYPARTKFRGFSQEANDRGYTRVSKWVAEHGDQLLRDCED